MADTMRWRYGDTKPVVCAVDSTTVIEIGDLLYLDTDDVKPASSQADGGTEAANQETFHDNFVGVAMQRSANGDTAPIRVATAGVFEFDCAAATFEIGDLVATTEAGSGTTLEDQQVVGGLTRNVNENLAVGRAVKRFASNTTSVLIEVQSTIMTGGPQAAA